MNKITCIILGTLFMVSCAKSKEKQMLYDYHQEYFDGLDLNLNDLDFKIHSLDKVKDIKASDSMKILKSELGEYWAKNPDQALIDTLSFEYVKDLLKETIVDKDTMSKLYQKAMITGMKIENPSYERDAERKRDEVIDEKIFYTETLSKVQALERYYNALAERPDSILSSMYKAKYSLNNPRLNNANRTYNKLYYTNGIQTEFIKEEILEEE